MKTDKQLLNGFSENGKEVIFEELFKRYHLVLWKKSLKMFRCREDAEDLLQDFWLYIFNNMPKIKTDEQGSAARFLHTVYTCDVYDFYKKRKWDTVSLDNALLEKLHDQSTISSNLVEEHIYIEEFQRLRVSILNTLPPKDRTLFHLYDKINLSVSEIALRCSLSEGTVRNKISSISAIVNSRLRSIYAAVSIIVWLFIGHIF